MKAIETPVREKAKKQRLPPLTQEELRVIRTQLAGVSDTVVLYDREKLLRIVDVAINGTGRMSFTDALMHRAWDLFGGEK